MNKDQEIRCVTNNPMSKEDALELLGVAKKLYPEAFNKKIVCPVCKNEEIKSTDNYCMICGRKIVKKAALEDA